MIHAKNENFVMHRRVILTIALKIDDRNEKDENFIVANETNEKKVNKTIVINEIMKKKVIKVLKFFIILIFIVFVLIISLIFIISNLTLNSRDCLTKILLTIVTIVIFNF